MLSRASILADDLSEQVGSSEHSTLPAEKKERSINTDDPSLDVETTLNEIEDLIASTSTQITDPPIPP